MDTDLAALRQEYELGGLAEEDLTESPVELFERWFSQAHAGGVHEPNAMVLATVAPDGRPSARTVLLKGLTDAGFCFFTNYDSRKGGELGTEAHCALLFGWIELQRQVRVEGVAERVPRSDSETYFASRPRPSQLGAWASSQSSVVASRDELDATYAAAEARFEGVEVPCPPQWGGYVVQPSSVEFWQGRRSRMHDRLRYTRSGDGWTVERLAP